MSSKKEFRRRPGGNAVHTERLIAYNTSLEPPSQAGSIRYFQFPTQSFEIILYDKEQRPPIEA